jgi:hypothetical protein
MTPEDRKLVHALVHHVHVLLTGDQPEDLDRDRTLASVKRSIALADKILSGNATDEDKASVADVVHPQIRSFYL